MVLLGVQLPFASVELACVAIVMLHHWLFAMIMCGNLIPAGRNSPRSAQRMSLSLKRAKGVSAECPADSFFHVFHGTCSRMA